MLDSILLAHRAQLTALANDWLASGATSFAMWSDDAPIEVWPAHPAEQTNYLTEPIWINGQMVGELRVTGVDTPTAQERLKAEADIVQHLVRMEYELNNIAEELIDTRDQLLALYGLTQATRNFLDTEQLLETLALETARLAKVEGALFYVQMEEREPLVRYYPSPVLDLETLQGFIAEIKATNQEYMWSQDATVESRIKNLLLVPIHIRGAETAVLGIFNKLGGGGFTSPDVKLASAIAEHAGAQIENVVMYQANLEQARLQTEMELAQRVQLQLLPQKPPVVTGLDLWSGSKPASQVGGDFYDFVAPKDQAFSFAVGDISGKGMPAALLMAMTRMMIRSKINVDPMPTPEAVMDSANAELYNDFTDVSMFATVFIGQYHSQKRELIYANAGHSPVIYCPIDGQPQLLEADGTPMGILPVSLSADQRLVFRPGDVLVVGTDGFNEARNEQDEMFGYERLMQLIASLASQSAKEIADGLYSAVAHFEQHTHQDDDQTLFVLKCTES